MRGDFCFFQSVFQTPKRVLDIQEVSKNKLTILLVVILWVQIQYLLTSWDNGNGEQIKMNCPIKQKILANRMKEYLTNLFSQTTQRA